MDGLVVLITGASRGIGRAIALKAAADGAKVIVNYVSDVKAADSVVSQIGADRAVAVQADISKTQEVEYLVHSAVSLFGKIDVLIPNAVYMPAGDIEALTEDQFDRTFGVNVKGPCFLVQKAIPHMPPGSTIIFISSDLTDFNVLPPHYLLYISTKAALNQMVRVLAQNLGQKKIRVNAISPGATETEQFLANNSNDIVRSLADLSPFKRLGKPDEIATAVSLLWRKESEWITGQVVRVNGGAT
ncbi:oxidoreductase, short-chain dehydrogenase/reductase family, putative [Paecilomyces variotii No. 5]|uniref:Oxidoreductase, short-chain dehydrogenase/reductase family, putative n=1 Tax=Byssochlamys spectabilis (strain No. 5 / NBRC 109023) TaxID=1356009 RepID=V5FRI6_BYSSN|nr:oxidoreductase, short-chain dehydrogenase/reductase family, putative [Paecilomyces variotii No. 5]